MTLSTQVLIGLVLGIATGVFFGEEAARIQFIGDAFIMLLQMTVMPFILVSLVGALGGLDARSARELGWRAGTFLLVVWGLVLAIVVALPLAFPPLETASFFSSSLVAEKQTFDFLALYIPANPIYALSHNVVPALVLFSAILGVALIPVEGKEGILRALATLAETLTRITGYVARLAPLGVFALISSAAGTIGLEELERLQVYVVLYALLAALLTFVILPGLISALTPLTWWDVVPMVRDPIITAFAAGNLLIVIPILTRQATEIASAKIADSGRAESVVDVIVPASFNFPSAGKLLSLGFLPFAAWFSGSSISASDLPRFLVTGLFSFFGATSVAVPFLLDMLRLPHDLFQVFLAVDVITGRFQVMVAAMCTVALALLGAFSMTGAIRIQPTRLLRFGLVSIVSLGAILVGVRVGYGTLLNLESTSYETFLEMGLSEGEAMAQFTPEEPPVPKRPLEGSRLERIDRDSLLRVCIHPDSLPYAFVNGSNELVGFDIEMAYALAGELAVDLAFVRVARSESFAHLDGGTCDIVMSGTAMTPDRTRHVTFSIPYMTTHLAFIVPDHLRDRFASWPKLGKEVDLEILAPTSKHYTPMLRSLVPHANIRPLEDLRAYFRGQDPADGLLFTAEAGSAWTLVYPSFTVVVPDPKPINVPISYPLPRGDYELKSFVDTWISMAQSQGKVDALFTHWIKGEVRGQRKPRWSILNDVILARAKESSQEATPTNSPPKADAPAAEASAAESGEDD